MRDAAPQKIYLSDYKPFTHRIERTKLHFKLDPSATRVTSSIRFVPNDINHTRLKLHGESLKLIWARIDGVPVTPEVDAHGLSVDVPDGPFTWEAEVEINPSENKALEGLYMSNGMYCTQCEAEGFRRISYYPDRPDVMAPFEVVIEGNSKVLLSNGNLIASQAGRAEWHDPWPKPSYLFALVAGDLVSIQDCFTTRAGRDVDLAIWVRPGDEGRADFALEALKKSMRWDEDVFGLDYDLDVFNIVAVDDFNMGAMENKGLNIFNSKYVLADPSSATDRDYELIEAIVAHEYFHNWTGNRITCRDWFQLCLKEGLTVYRDQQFTSDMRSAGVKRIEDVDMLRRRQFREDAGPLAHPVRPEEYAEINNFYTATVYEKGAEIIGMLRCVVGENAWQRGCALYFSRHDGHAATIEDWLACFAEASGRDLSQFQLWYSQAGTPIVSVSPRVEDGKLTVALRQQLPDTPGQNEKRPMVIPFRLGALNEAGEEILSTQTLILDREHAEWSFDVKDRPILSALRGFSAPVKLAFEQSWADRVLLMAHDRDPFVRREAARSLGMECLMAIGQGEAPNDDFLTAFGHLLGDEAADPAFRALAASLPSEEEVATTLHERGAVPDPEAIHRARQGLKAAIGAHHRDLLADLVERSRMRGPYSSEPGPAGQRALWRLCLGYLGAVDGGQAAQEAFATAQNMTEVLASLVVLIEQNQGDAALKVLEQRWLDDRLAMDKWFNIQLAACPPDLAVERCQKLLAHEKFEITNPNRVRSVLGGLIVNQAGFHRQDGAGYRLLAEQLSRLDGINPQTAARLATAFETWRRFDQPRKVHAEQALQTLQSKPDLSPDMRDMVARMLA